VSGRWHRWRRAAIWLVLVAWCLAMVASGLALAAEPVGDGFTRGMNRTIGFLGWQLGAAMLALVAWLAARPLPRGALLRRLAFVPGWWCVGLLVVFAGLVGVALLGPAA